MDLCPNLIPHFLKKKVDDKTVCVSVCVCIYIYIEFETNGSIKVVVRKCQYHVPGTTADFLSNIMYLDLQTYFFHWFAFSAKS